MKRTNWSPDAWSQEELSILKYGKRLHSEQILLLLPGRNLQMIKSARYARGYPMNQKRIEQKYIRKYGKKKVCITCNTNKFLSEFYPYVTPLRRGKCYSSYCKACNVTRTKKWRLKNAKRLTLYINGRKEESRKIHLAYYQKNKKTLTRYARERWKKDTEELSDRYMQTLLAQNYRVMGIKILAKDIPKSLIQIKRRILKVLRKINN